MIDSTAVFDALVRELESAFQEVRLVNVDAGENRHFALQDPVGHWRLMVSERYLDGEEDLATSVARVAQWGLIDTIKESPVGSTIMLGENGVARG